jgi:hypothetical protein
MEPCPGHFLHPALIPSGVGSIAIRAGRRAVARYECHDYAPDGDGSQHTPTQNTLLRCQARHADRSCQRGLAGHPVPAHRKTVISPTFRATDRPGSTTGNRGRGGKTLVAGSGAAPSRAARPEGRPCCVPSAGGTRHPPGRASWWGARTPAGRPERASTVPWGATESVTYHEMTLSPGTPDRQRPGGTVAPVGGAGLGPPGQACRIPIVQISPDPGDVQPRAPAYAGRRHHPGDGAGGGRRRAWAARWRSSPGRFPARACRPSGRSGWASASNAGPNCPVAYPARGSRGQSGLSELVLLALVGERRRMTGTPPTGVPAARKG